VSVSYPLSDRDHTVLEYHILDQSGSSRAVGECASANHSLGNYVDAPWLQLPALRSKQGRYVRLARLAARSLSSPLFEFPLLIERARCCCRATVAVTRDPADHGSLHPDPSSIPDSVMSHSFLCSRPYSS